MKIDSKEKQLLKVILIAILFYFALLRIDLIFNTFNNSIKLLKPFIYGGVMAFIVNVPMNKIEKMLKKLKIKKGLRLIAYLITVTLIVGFISGFLFIIIPQIVETLFTLIEHLQAFYNTLPQLKADSSSIMATLEEYFAILNIDIEAAFRSFITMLKDFSIGILGKSSAVITGIVDGFTTFLFSCIFSVYLVMGKEKNKKALSELLNAVLPKRISDRIFHIASITYKAFASFISGQCFEAIILGTMFVITMTMFGLPYALLIGVTIAVTALIPIFGAFIGCIVGVVFIAIESPVQAFWFVVLFIVLQQIEGNVVYPQVVGNSIGLPSILVFVSVTIGGKLMGITGMVLFIPMASVIYTLLKEFVEYKKSINQPKEELPIEEVGQET